MEAGTRVGPYEIVDKLGVGGMGEVWRATDPRLQRDVAIKLLPAGVAGDDELLARFRQEARLLAQLNHPNIAAIYGLEDLGDSVAIVMELVDGPSLADLIALGPMAVPECARIGSEIAEGLSSAHARGIVHRDLKPDNVRIAAGGRVKILDLGLAKVAAPDATAGGESSDVTETVAAMTREGIVVGTAPYMSPEQAVGAAVDGRTDVWAFGAMLFEMLSGERAIAGRSMAEILGAVVRGEVQWQVLPAGVPRELRRLMERCLQREAESRLSDLNEARAALLPFTSRGFAAAPQAQADSKSIVVLPFANLSPDPDTEYFSDGLTDEIITDLSRIRALRVISRSSAMRLKGDPRDLGTIGRDLGCRYVLEGTVRRAANSLRMTARLVDAPSDAQLWADKYAGTLDDVFDIQERVSRAIVEALEIRLTPREQQQLAERPIEDVRAQESYLRARSEIWSFLPADLGRAVSHLQAALDLVGDNVVLYQGLGEAYYQYVNVGMALGREEEYLDKSEACAERIFALEPESPYGYLVRARAQLARGNVHECGRSFRRVLRALPSDVPAMWLYCHVLAWLVGKPEVAAPLAARLAEVDPLNPASLLASVSVPMFSGRFADALEPARRMIAVDPVTPVWRGIYAMVLMYNERLDEAEALTEGVVANADSDIGTWGMALSRAAWRRDRAEVLRLATGRYLQTALWDQEIPWMLATAHAAVGETDKALHWLERTIANGMINYPFLSEHDRYLDNIRGDARFGPLMERARTEWERFET